MRQTDPQAVGEWLFQERKKTGYFKFSALADQIPWYLLPEIDKSMSMGKEAALQYQSELHQRAADGDRFAKAVLEEGSWDEPGA